MGNMLNMKSCLLLCLTILTPDYQSWKLKTCTLLPLNYLKSSQVYSKEILKLN